MKGSSVRIRWSAHFPLPSGGLFHPLRGKHASMILSQLAETLIGSEIVKLGGEIRDKIRQGERIYNFTVGDFDPSIFPIPALLEEEIINAYRNHFTNYPAAEGNLDLREAISVFMKEMQQLEYSSDEILVAS